MILARHATRGSRRHLLDWVEAPTFINEINDLVAPAGARIDRSDAWGPNGWHDAREPRLETFGPRHLPEALDWSQLLRWWLVHSARANTPNWDLAATCTVEGRRGLVLVEAKAHSFELGMSGKTLRTDASERSRDNHERIRDAIAEAGQALTASVPGVHISASRTYQLANRIAHAWWLAKHGIPTVLVYLAFLNDERMVDIGEPIRSQEDWSRWFEIHARGVVPAEFADRWIDCGEAGMYFTLASLSMPRGYDDPQGAA
jgi:hypothetical protein